MGQQLDRDTLSQILEARDIAQLSFPTLIRLFQQEMAHAKVEHAKTESGAQPGIGSGEEELGYAGVRDPRSKDYTLFNPARARRPHDNEPKRDRVRQGEQRCIICQGQTTGVVDVADLSAGFTFINKNLYPVLTPLSAERRLGNDERCPYGFHFVQWTSSLHDRDWHNMPLSDCITVMQRLAALERKLLLEGRAFWPSVTPDDMPGFASILKNYGRLVGGSLVHGHQQIVFSNIMPRRVLDDQHFEHMHGEPFSAYLLRENPAELLLRDYGPAVLVVPYFMRRPYDMMLLVKDTRKRYLHALTAAEIAATAEGWQDAIGAIRRIMPRVGRETAYNVITHNGPGAGLYFEFLPYTQEMGGLEHLGLFVCQASPDSVAAELRHVL